MIGRIIKSNSSTLGPPSGTQGILEIDHPNPLFSWVTFGRPKNRIRVSRTILELVRMNVKEMTSLEGMSSLLIMAGTAARFVPILETGENEKAQVTRYHLSDQTLEPGVRHK